MLKDDVINNVKVGDWVVAEIEVTGVDQFSGNLRWGSLQVGTGWVKPEHIIEHKPGEVELQVGMKIPKLGSIATILGIYDDRVWIVWSDQSQGLHPVNTVKQWARDAR